MSVSKKKKAGGKKKSTDWRKVAKIGAVVTTVLLGVMEGVSGVYGALSKGDRK